MKKHIITGIEPGSIAEELGIKPGDRLLSINGTEIKDVFDFRYLCAVEYFELLTESGNDELLYEIEKDADEELGLIFDSGLMDSAKSCVNKCIFCFVDQLPENMRETLYFKDDDVRLSFLRGNYVTLTNISGAELDRMIFYHLSPINISVHTTNPELRVKMLGNRRAKALLEILDKIATSGIEMNFQVVLCKGINDGAELDRTIRELAEYVPNAKSLSVVPVGLSRHRTGLAELAGFTREDSLRLLEQIGEWQNVFLKEHGTRFVYPADEFYISAGISCPPYESYEDFPQIENGVGMMAHFQKEFLDALGSFKDLQGRGGVSVVTGAASRDFIGGLCERLKKEVDGLSINVYDIRNDFFGENITVSGLLTGTDISAQLEGKDIGGRLLLPLNCLRAGEDVFLDGMTVGGLEKKLRTEITTAGNGYDFVKACAGGIK